MFLSNTIKISCIGVIGCVNIFLCLQKNQTVLSENICRGVVGGRLDFPRSASFAAVKIVLWLEEEFIIAFQ